MSEDRRRLLVGGFLLLGTLLLALSFRIEPGNAWFYPATAALAVAWAAGALLAGPPPLGRRAPARPLLVGVALATACIVGALVVREVSHLDDQVGSVAAYAERGSGPLIVLAAVVAGITEELFFRGVLYDQLPQPVVGTTIAYTLVTLATGNVMLVLAAALLGAVTALERRRSGGVLAPALVHATWSLAMLIALPLLF